MEDAARDHPDDQPRSEARRTPVRTCVGCRRRAEQSALLRVIAVQDGQTSLWGLRPDPRRRGQGRGAYVHPVQECLRTAVTRRAFTRALRLPAGSAVEAGQVEDWLRQQSG